MWRTHEGSPTGGGIVAGESAWKPQVVAPEDDGIQLLAAPRSTPQRGGYNKNFGKLLITTSRKIGDEKAVGPSIRPRQELT